MKPRPRDIVRAAHRWAARKLTALADDATPNEVSVFDAEGLERFRIELRDISDRLAAKGEGRKRSTVPVRICAACGGKLYGGRRTCRCGCWNGPKKY